MMKELGLTKEDLDDVVVEEEEPLPADVNRQKNILTVLTGKEQSSCILQDYEGSMGSCATSSNPPIEGRFVHFAVLLSW